MKLSNKGFAISSIMYIILVLGVILMVITLALLGGRKLVLDKLKGEVISGIYDEVNVDPPSIEPICILASDSTKKGIEVGAKYSCDFGGGTRNFYILELGSNRVTGSTLKSDEVALILEGNYETTTQCWCDVNPGNNACALDGLTAKLDEIVGVWTKLKREQIGLPSAEQIMVADGRFDNAYLNKPRLTNTWLYKWPGNDDYNNANGPSYGYWTSTTLDGSSDSMWIVSYYGNISSTTVGYCSGGVRPVVNLKFSIFQI